MKHALAAILLGLVPFIAPGAAHAADAPPLQSAVSEYARLAVIPADARCAPEVTIAVPVALDQGLPPVTTFDASSGRLHILYRMMFNQLTEGWNWQPLAAIAGGDYYRFKYLPLGATHEQRPGYRGEDKIGTPQDFRVEWHTDYFFAFDNPYDFYPDTPDDDAGFAADVILPQADAERLAHGDLRMALRAHLKQDCLSDSTTFWKATSAQPVDFTLKKRYLIGTLDEVLFYDAANGQILERLNRTTKGRHPH